MERGMVFPREIADGWSLATRDVCGAEARPAMQTGGKAHRNASWCIGTEQADASSCVVPSCATCAEGRDSRVIGSWMVLESFDMLRVGLSGKSNTFGGVA